MYKIRIYIYINVRLNWRVITKLRTTSHAQFTDNRENTHFKTEVQNENTIISYARQRRLHESTLLMLPRDTKNRNDSTSPRTSLSIRQRTSTKKIRLRESTYVHVHPTTYINDEVTTPRVHVRPCRLDNARQQRINDLASPTLSWPRGKRARSAPTHQQTGEL